MDVAQEQDRCGPIRQRGHEQRDDEQRGSVILPAPALAATVAGLFLLGVSLAVPGVRVPTSDLRLDEQTLEPS